MRPWGSNIEKEEKVKNKNKNKKEAVVPKVSLEDVILDKDKETCARRMTNRMSVATPHENLSCFWVRTPVEGNPGDLRGSHELECLLLRHKNPDHT